MKQMSFDPAVWSAVQGLVYVCSKWAWRPTVCTSYCKEQVW